KHGAESSLGKLLGLPVVVLHLYHRLVGVENLPIHNRIYLQGNVVASDDVLRRDLQGLLPQIDPHHLLHRRENEDDTWTLGIGAKVAEGEDYGAFVLAQNFNGIQGPKKQNDDDDQKANSWHSASTEIKI